MAEKGIGVRLIRKEDDRHLHGRGNFVADIKLAGMKDVAFVRSRVAHGRIFAIHIPPMAAGSVFVGDDLKGVKPIRALSKLPGYKVSDYAILARGKVRFVGELVAMCLGDTRAEAEDLARQVSPDYEDLGAVSSMFEAQKPDAPLLHEHWGNNVVLETFTEGGDLDTIAAQAPIVIEREFRMSRQATVPMEGTGVVAFWDSRMDQLTLYSSTQFPNIVRTGLAECLGLEQRRIPVIAPDVGGGFGYKGVLHPEEVAVAWLAMQTRRPVRWIEDRFEHLRAGANCREHHYNVTAYADNRGRLLGLKAEITIDAGAYSSYPFTCCLEAVMAAGNLPGPYMLKAYRARTRTVATNKPPIVPYRGVARPGVCFAMELTIDAIARAVGREPYEVRLENLVAPAAMPYTSVTGKYFDSGDYPEGLRSAARLIEFSALRERQCQGEADGRLVGVGFATFTEQTAHGTSVFATWGSPIVPGYEQATVRLEPDGGLEIRVGVQSHGQGLETTLAQIASEVLGIEPSRVTIIHGDTSLTPYSTGTYASRSIVMAGGAVARACRVLADRMRKIAAHLLRCPMDEVNVREGKLWGPHASIEFAEAGRVWHFNPEELPPDVDVGGVEATVGYRPEQDSGAFSYSTHAAVVAVDPELGAVEILDYAIVEDCGTMVNPMIVEGQIYGGAAQGIGTALYEETPFDASGQPLAVRLGDYLLPTSLEVPRIRLEHMETPSPLTEFGIKGIGESGAIAPPAAITNAINDALRPLGAEVTETPATLRRILAAIGRARAERQSEGSA
jgi:aerobic carbon-monoxide dehydrogenase large subunit